MAVPATSVVRRQAIKTNLSLSLSRQRFPAHCRQAWNFCLNFAFACMAFRALAFCWLTQKHAALLLKECRPACASSSLSLQPHAPPACQRQSAQGPAAVFETEHLANHADLEQDQQWVVAGQAEALKMSSLSSNKHVWHQEKIYSWMLSAWLWHQSVHAQQA